MDKFPSRQVLSKFIQLRGTSPLVVRSTAAVTADLRVAAALHDEAAPQSPLLAMVLGIDAEPRELTIGEIESFGDPFTQLLLLRGVAPLTLEELSSAIDALAGDEARPISKVYAIAEGAAFQSTIPSLPLNTRLVITWQTDAATGPDLLLSTSPDPQDPDSLMQLIAWSEAQGVYHFFERKRGRWAWAGNSLHALSAPSRGKGPFDSHVNGGLVIKELKFPWIHWHSQANGIPVQLIFPTAFGAHPLSKKIQGAEVLELAVQAGVRRWTRRRVAANVQGSEFSGVESCAKQVLWTTSVNLVSSGMLSRRLASQSEFVLPRTFFFDDDGINEAIAHMDDAQLSLPQEISVDAQLYTQGLAKFNVHVEATPAGPSVAGDTEFAFVVPERAFEDLAVIAELLKTKILSPRLALCLLMVDFSNPIFSPDRAELLDFFPDKAVIGNGGADLDKIVIQAARQASAGSEPARELLRLWDDVDLIQNIQRRLANYLIAVQSRLRTPEGVFDLLQLAGSRKEAFRGRKLHEFAHTLAVSSPTVAHLAMHRDGSVFKKVSTKGEGEK